MSIDVNKVEKTKLLQLPNHDPNPIQTHVCFSAKMQLLHAAPVKNETLTRTGKALLDPFGGPGLDDDAAYEKLMSKLNEEAVLFLGGK